MILRLVLLVFLFVGSQLRGLESRPNILFIAIDDLRCELGCYGSKIVKSPNMDRFARTAIRFDRAYCQQAICGPSRASVMTGLRPDTIQIHGNHTHFRTVYPDIVTLPQLFKNHGYHTRSMGKIYHGVFPEGSSRTVPDTFGDETSWSIPTFRPGPRYYYTGEGMAAAKNIYEKVYKPKNPGPDDWTKKLVFGPATEAPDVADEILYDGQVANRAIASLEELANRKDPFFLAVGFIKPHSPYIAPKKYWDLYEADSIPLASELTRETDAPKIALHGSGELRRYTDQQKSGPIPEAAQRKVRHAYFACISYIDAQIGRVLAQLEKQNLADDTIVVLWSDHGYHLGEKNLWGKTTNFELDTRVPLMIRVPGKKAGVCLSPVELVDLYPTLADLAGLPIDDTLQGTSLQKVIDNPDQLAKCAAFSQFTRGKHRGYSVRNQRYRYTEWIDLKTGLVEERLLFDHETDPHESQNIADSADPRLLDRMKELLAHGEGWRNIVPPGLKLGKPFTDHIVLQRNEPIRIWGTAEPGSAVEISFGETKHPTEADSEGNWEITLAAQTENSIPQKLTVTSGGQSVLCDDILIGDVWMCSGQSNMRWMLKQTEHATESIANSANPKLRIYHLESTIHPGGSKFSLRELRNTFADNLFTTDGWQVAGPETVPDFSGVAYHFGRVLQINTGVPIGLIHNAVGGSPMEAWIPSRHSNSNWLANADLPRWVAGRAKLNLAHWLEHPALPTPHHPFEPGFLFEAGIRPFLKMPIRGVIWYQGESNATEDGSGSPAIDPNKNFTSHQKLIKSWRQGWNRESLPFYLVQLPGLNRDWAPFREVQTKIDLLVPNTYRAVTIDLGDPGNVHPVHKKPVGERLARLALQHEYQKGIIAEAPRLTGWTKKAGTIQLQFDRPIAITDHADISIAGNDRIFRSVPLSQDEPTVLSLPYGSSDVEAIRYAWENDPEASLICAATELPVAPFRTDDWTLVIDKNRLEAPKENTFYTTGFEKVRPGVFESLTINGATWTSKADHVEVDPKHAKSGKQCLHLLGGDKRQVTVHFSEPAPKGAVIEFAAERWTSRAPFKFIIYSTAGGDQWTELYDGTRDTKVGRSFLSQINIILTKAVTGLRFISTAPPASGLLIDDFRIYHPTPMVLGEIVTRQPVYPVLIGKAENPVLDVLVNINGQIGDPFTLEGLRIKTTGTDDPNDLAHIRILLNGEPIGKPTAPNTSLELPSEVKLTPGENVVQVSYRLKPTASLDRQVDASCSEIKINGTWHKLANPSPPGRKRIGFALRQKGQDGVNSTRIPGLATSNAGTLIAVYDNRNRARGDLPGDIDVGMNRSTDGGQTWEPMRVIMDMGNDPEWKYDGIGDPAVLVDRVTGTIWVAATWSHGNRSWHGSGPGLEPEETGQLMLVKSDDDGRTWSKPINITKQVKNPKWRFVLQGPGKGITMRDGTLVFPAQFRGENEEPVNGRPFSTLIYSKDRGLSWKIGSGVKIDTTEAQLVELGDGSIMINCRDNRGGSRSIYTTKDLGTTWQAHPTTRKALPEPVCMASLIRLETKQHGPLLFFSNPPQSRGRTNMTIKVSKDEGLTWPQKWHRLVDSGATAYSCMTAIGDDKIGLVYETPGELVFVRYSIRELLSDR